MKKPMSKLLLATMVAGNLMQGGILLAQDGKPGGDAKVTVSSPSQGSGNASASGDKMPAFPQAKIDEVMALCNAYKASAAAPVEKRAELFSRYVNGVKDVTKWKTSVVTEAIKQKDYEVASYLIEHGADVNEVDSHVYTPLYAAVRGNNTSLVETLLKHGANPNGSMFSPLGEACIANDRKGNIAIIKLLLKYKVDVRKPMMGDGYPLMVTSNFEIAKLLIDNGADAKYVRLNGFSVLMGVAFSIEKPQLDLYVEKGVDLNAVNTDDGKTILDYVSQAREDELKIPKAEFVAYLKNHGAKTGAEIKASQAAKAKLAEIPKTKPKQKHEPSAEFVKWLKLAEKKDVDAQVKVGRMLLYGIQVDEDKVEAFNWFSKADKQGSPNAQFEIGKMLYSGEGVPKNTTDGLGWMAKAAEQGLVDAQMILYALYMYGDGDVQQSDNDAVKWLRLAALQGSSRALLSLATMHYAKGKGVPKDIIETYALLKVAKDFASPKEKSSMQEQMDALEKNQKMSPEDIRQATKRYEAWIQDIKQCKKPPESTPAPGQTDTLAADDKKTVMPKAKPSVLKLARENQNQQVAEELIKAGAK